MINFYGDEIVKIRAILSSILKKFTIYIFFILFVLIMIKTIGLGCNFHEKIGLTRLNANIRVLLLVGLYVCMHYCYFLVTKGRNYKSYK